MAGGGGEGCQPDTPCSFLENISSNERVKL